MVTLHSDKITSDVLIINGTDDAEADTEKVADAVEAVNNAGGGTIELRGRIQISAEQVFTTGEVTLRGGKDHVIIPAFDNDPFTSPRLGNFDCVFSFKPTTGYSPNQISTTTTELTSDKDTILVTNGHLGGNNVKAGDWLILQSDKKDTGTDGGAVTAVFFGQSVKVAGVDLSGNPDLLFIASPLIETIQRTTITTIRNIQPLRHIYVNDLVFENPENKLVSLVEFYAVQDSQINRLHARRENVTGVGASGGLLMNNCFDVEINDYVHEGVTDRLMSGAYGHQEFYGIIFTGHGVLHVNNPIIRDTRHALTTSGGNANCVVHINGGFLSNKGSTVLDSHDNGFVFAKDVTIESTRRPDDDDGYDNNPRCINMRSTGAVIDGCRLYSNGECCTFTGSNNTIRNCSINGHGGDVLLTTDGVGGSPGVSCLGRTDIKIIDNVFHQTGRYGIHCDDTVNALIQGNQFYNTCSIDQNQHIRAQRAEGLIVTGNYLAKNPNVSFSVLNIDTPAPVTPARFNNNICTGYGSGDDGFSDGSAVTTACVAEADDDNFTDVAHGLVVDDRVIIAAGTMPSGLKVDTLYYIVNTAADTFQVAITPGTACVAEANDNDFTGENHGLVDDNRISFSATTIPAGLDPAVLYWVVNAVDDGVGGSADTFQVSLLQGGSVETFTTDGADVQWTLDGPVTFSTDGVSVTWEQPRSRYVSDTPKSNTTDGPSEEITIEVFGYLTAVSGGASKAFVRIPSRLHGARVMSVSAELGNAVSTSGDPEVQIVRARFDTPGGSRTLTDLLSTTLKVDQDEWSSVSSATPAVVDSSESELHTDDILWIDVDTAGTGTTGLYVTIEIE